jgi:hypothetical protein
VDAVASETSPPRPARSRVVGIGTRAAIGIAVAAALLVGVLVSGSVLGPDTQAAVSGGWRTTATASPTTVAPGGTTTITVSVRAAKAQTALVDIEVYSPSGGRLRQRVLDNQQFAASTTRRFKLHLTVPATNPSEDLTVKVGVFSPGWGTLRHWNDAAATVTVAPTSATTPPPTTAPTSTTTPTTTAPPTTTPPASGLPARPAAWPATLQLGMADSPGGAGALRQSVPVGLRYQYLAGGVNTGGGWANWNPNGDFARYYIEESRANGVIPVFSYYQIFQSQPGGSMPEADGVLTNLNTSSTMAAYYADLKLFFQKAGAAGGTTVLHVEPDMWAYIQQRASNNDPRTVPVRVASTGVADVAGLPDDAAGFAQAIVRLRDRYAPNVVLGYHFSTWGTKNDFLYSDPSDSVVDGLGVTTGRFYRSLGAPFDVAFTDIADRDAEFKRIQWGVQGAWMTADDYRRSATYISAFVRTAGIRAVLWQLPYGNTKMRAVDNTWNHYQDNKVEWLLDDPSRANLAAYADAGVIAFMFGRGADGVTCACDANQDGVTNPAPINGNNAASLSADDDGGFFRDRANTYYRGGPLALR